MRKYQYWHIIMEVGKEYGKNTKLKKGMIISHHYKKDGMWVSIIDTKEGKVYDKAYKLDYLGRLESNLSGDNLVNPINKWIDEKGYRKIVDKYDKEDANSQKSEVKE